MLRVHNFGAIASSNLYENKLFPVNLNNDEK